MSRIPLREEALFADALAQPPALWWVFVDGPGNGFLELRITTMGRTGAERDRLRRGEGDVGLSDEWRSSRRSSTSSRFGANIQFLDSSAFRGEFSFSNMNTSMKLNTRVAVLLVALCAFGSAHLQSQAPKSQTKSPVNSADEGYLMLTFTTVKPERVAEFERLQKEELNPALKKAGVTMRFASTRATVGEGYAYVFGTPLKNFAELDGDDNLTRSLGRDKATALLEKVRACHVSSRTVVVRNIPDLSWGLETPMPYFVVTSIQLVNGKKADWLKYQREVAPALRKSGLATAVVQETVYGGDENMVYTLRRFDRFADLDSNPLRQHMGEEAYNALVAKRPREAVARIERMLARHRADLSIVPETKSNAAK